MSAKTKAGLLIALIFFAGLAGGVALDRLALWRIRPVSIFARPPGTTEPFLLRFGRDLNLTPEQRRELERILEDSRKQMMQMAPQLERVRQTANKRLEAILSPEQRTRWIEFRRRHWQRMRRFRRGMGPRGRMGPMRGMGMGRGRAYPERPARESD